MGQGSGIAKLHGAHWDMCPSNCRHVCKLSTLSMVSIFWVPVIFHFGVQISRWGTYFGVQIFRRSMCQKCIPWNQTKFYVPLRKFVPSEYVSLLEICKIKFICTTQIIMYLSRKFAPLQEFVSLQEIFVPQNRYPFWKFVPQIEISQVVKRLLHFDTNIAPYFVLRAC